jgi:hypothetical protein
MKQKVDSSQRQISIDKPLDNLIRRRKLKLIAFAIKGTSQKTLRKSRES